MNVVLRDVSETQQGLHKMVKHRTQIMHSNKHKEKIYYYSSAERVLFHWKLTSTKLGIRVILMCFVYLVQVLSYNPHCKVDH